MFSPAVHFDKEFGKEGRRLLIWGAFHLHRGAFLTCSVILPAPAPPPPEPAADVPKVKDDPRYARYFKMIGFGVPLAQVKQKMMFEGINPDVLDNPDAPADSTIVASSKPAEMDGDDSGDSSGEGS